MELWEATQGLREATRAWAAQCPWAADSNSTTQGGDGEQAKAEPAHAQIHAAQLVRLIARACAWRVIMHLWHYLAPSEIYNISHLTYNM